jgi:hypothetical protein
MADKTNDLQELFEGIGSDILTEDVQLKIATIFEATVNEAIKAKEQELEEQNAVELSDFKEELVEQMDSYLDYFTKEYIKENEQIIEDFSKVKLAEKVLRNFQQMVEAFNISLSDESIQTEDEVEELKTENTKLVNKLIESRKEVENVKKAAMIAEAQDALETDVQKEKLVEMAKGLEFDQELFESKLSILVEKILSDKEEIKEEKLEEKQEDEIVVKPVSKIADYLKAL